MLFSTLLYCGKGQRKAKVYIFLPSLSHAAAEHKVGQLGPDSISGARLLFFIFFSSVRGANFTATMHVNNSELNITQRRRRKRRRRRRSYTLKHLLQLLIDKYLLIFHHLPVV